MRLVTARLQSASAYSQSKHYVKDPQQGEGPDDYYRRTWRNHLHVDETTGLVFIPNNSIKNCLSEAAKFMSIGIPGKGKATYTKNFEAGVMVGGPININIHRDDVAYEQLFLPSDGVRGGKKRVWKYYPLIPSWEGDAQFYIVDETVLQSSVRDKTKTVFEEVLEGAGQFIGLGRFRPRNNGYYGRFNVLNVTGI